MVIRQFFFTNHKFLLVLTGSIYQNPCCIYFIKIIYLALYLSIMNKLRIATRLRTMLALVISAWSFIILPAIPAYSVSTLPTSSADLDDSQTSLDLADLASQTGSLLTSGNWTPGVSWSQHLDPDAVRSRRTLSGTRRPSVSAVR